MTDERIPYGLIFCGPPGIFSVWMTLPDALLLDREGAELLGQYAIRAGAADYRPFPLDTEQRQAAMRQSEAAHGDPRFAGEPDICALARSLAECEGVPSGSGMRPRIEADG